MFCGENQARIRPVSYGENLVGPYKNGGSGQKCRPLLFLGKNIPVLLGIGIIYNDIILMKIMMVNNIECVKSITD